GQDRRPGETPRSVCTSRSHRESYSIVFPMKHVIRDCVIPTHVAPDCGFRVVLKEHVIFASKINWAVRVIHPVVCRQQMKLGAAWILGERGSQRILWHTPQ